MNPSACTGVETCGYHAGEAPAEYALGETLGCRNCNGCWSSGKCYPAEQYSFDSATSTMTHMPSGASQTM